MAKVCIGAGALTITVLCTALCLSAAAADRQFEIDSMNALVEQVFGNIPEPGVKADAALAAKVQEQGRVPVIVRLRDDGLPYGFFENTAAARTDVIRGLQRKVLEDVLGRTAGTEEDLHVSRFKYIPAMALLADEGALEALQDSPGVVDIVEDVPVPPALDDSVPLIGAEPDGSFAGLTGDGWAVAILDTGVDKNHPFLSGKVVSEACYSNAYGTATSLCPGGVSESTAAGSGLPCGMNGCFHGTHVAGIAAGSNETFSGVAKDADIIAIQVFTDTGSLGSYSADQIKALERVYELRTTYSIASANLSLGSSTTFSSACDDYSLNPTLKSKIDTLRAAGIATVIASGNGGDPDGISSPACISTAISVGNTTKMDALSASSSSADILSLLAPGSSIYSSIPGSGYAGASGTSMAAPHVAGAWAVLRQADPGASVSEILAALQETGVSVADTRDGAGGRVKPRIDVEAARSALGGCTTDNDCGDDRPFCDAGVCVECVGDGDCGEGFCADGVCAECLGDQDCDDFCVNGACVECRSGLDCTDGSYCNGAETCVQGACSVGISPCGGGLCDEGRDRCVECFNDSHCGSGYSCDAGVCREDCTLSIKYKPLTTKKLSKKDKKLKLKISGEECFDPYAPVDVGGLKILKKKPKVQYKKGVLKKNELQVIVLVPAGTDQGQIAVRVGASLGEIKVL